MEQQAPINTPPPPQTTPPVQMPAPVQQPQQFAYAPPGQQQAPAAEPEHMSAGGFLAKLDWLELGFMFFGSLGIFFTIYVARQKFKQDQERGKSQEKTNSDHMARIKGIERYLKIKPSTAAA
jgi:hypothetical protein